MTMKPVIIGKNIIEILTTGMYENPKVIFREYVQNAADAISQAVEQNLFKDNRDGMVNIHINPETRSIEVHDNAIGVPAEKAWKILTSVADSRKDRKKHLGFRGVGRLAGLAYCEKLIIETSAPGETVKSKLVWDGDKLRSIISNRKDQREAHTVIETITDFRNDLPEGSEQHYFKVELQGVKNNALLDIYDVEKYLRMVAPVAFSSKFLWKNTILSKLQEVGAPLQEYRLFVNQDEIFKSYRNRIYKEGKASEKTIDEIHNIELVEARNLAGEIVAIAWYSLTDLMQRIPIYNELVGLRIRKGNIQIGHQATMQRFFKDERFHNYFVGEIHVVSQNLLPNGQRDYFDESEYLTSFENNMKDLALKLTKLCRDASELKKVINDIKQLEDNETEFAKKQTEHMLVSENHEKEEEEQLAESRLKAEKAKKKLEQVKAKAEQDAPLQQILQRRATALKNCKPTEDSPLPKPIPRKSKRYLPNTLTPGAYRSWGSVLFLKK